MTRFKASYKDIECKFQLSVICVQKGSYWTVENFVKDHSYKLDLGSHCPRQVPTKIITFLITLKLQVNGHIIHPKEMVTKIHTDHDIQILYN